MAEKNIKVYHDIYLKVNEPFCSGKWQKNSKVYHAGLEKLTNANRSVSAVYSQLIPVELRNFREQSQVDFDKPPRVVLFELIQ